MPSYYGMVLILELLTLLAKSNSFAFGGMNYSFILLCSFGIAITCELKTFARTALMPCTLVGLLLPGQAGIQYLCVEKLRALC